MSDDCGAGPPRSSPQSTEVDHCLRDLHSEATGSLDLFRNRHYDEAVRKGSQRFVNRVKEMTSRPDLDGAGLINTVFSAKRPLLGFNERETPLESDEHDGYRYLALGLTRALRNVLTHHDHYGLTEIEAREWLMFISAMHRRLDRTDQVTADQDQERAEKPITEPEAD